jgi:uncharacterized protein YfaP (DUF2135 family)
MHYAFFARMATRVTKPASRARGLAGRTLVALIAAGTLAACADNTPVQPPAKVPEGGVKAAVMNLGVNIFADGQNFPEKVAFVTGSPNGKAAYVQVYDKNGKQMAQFKAFNDSWNTSGVDVALGDINGDGWPDIIAGEGPAQFSPYPSRLAYWDGRTGAWIGFIGVSDNRSGLRVGAGDVDGDGRDEMFACFGPSTGGTRVYVTYLAVNNHSVGFKTNSASLGTVTGKISYNGCRVAGGDLDNDGKDEIITAFEGPANTLMVSKYTGAMELASFVRPNAMYIGYNGQISVAAADVNGDKKAEIFLGRLTGVDRYPGVRIFDGAAVMDNTTLPLPVVTYPIMSSIYNSGIYVAAHDLNGDGVPELLAKLSTTGGYSMYVARKGPTFSSLYLNTFEPPGTLPGGGPIG